MSALVVRFAKRRAAWETADATQIREVEFRNRDGQYDLRPSIYLVDALEIIQTFAEHAAAAPIDPPGSALGIDFSGLRFDLEREEGNAKFEFTRDRHREIRLTSTSDLDAMISHACQDLTGRRRDVARASVHKYVAERLEEGDSEWLDLAGSNDAKDWVKKLAAKATKRLDPSK